MLISTADATLIGPGHPSELEADLFSTKTEISIPSSLQGERVRSNGKKITDRNKIQGRDLESTGVPKVNRLAKTLL